MTALLARYGQPAGRFGGGMAANTAYALACLGIPVGLVGRVGAGGAAFGEGPNRRF